MKLNNLFEDEYTDQKRSKTFQVNYVLNGEAIYNVQYLFKNKAKIIKVTPTCATC